MDDIRRHTADVPVVYTVEQVAEILQVSPRTVRMLTSRGDLPFRRLTGESRNARYTAEDIQAYLDRCRRVGRGKFTADPATLSARSGARPASSTEATIKSPAVVPLPKTRSRGK